MSLRVGDALVTENDYHLKINIIFCGASRTSVLF